MFKFKLTKNQKAAVKTAQDEETAACDNGLKGAVFCQIRDDGTVIGEFIQNGRAVKIKRILSKGD